MGIKKKHKKKTKGARIELPLEIHFLVKMGALKMGQTVPDHIISTLTSYYRMVGELSSRGNKE
jgi:hypothetical protein